MADTPYPIPRELRQTAILAGDGVSATYGPFAFKIFDIDDVTVYTQTAAASRFSKAAATVTKVSGLPQDFFTVTFPAVLPVSTQYVVTGARLAERSSGITKGTQLAPTALEKELSKQAVSLQELRRDIGLAVKADYGQEPQTLPVPQAGRILAWGVDGRLDNFLPVISDVVPFGDVGVDLAAAQTTPEALNALGQPLTPSTMLVDNAAGDARVSLPFDGVAALLNGRFQPLLTTNVNTDLRVGVPLFGESVTGYPGVGDWYVYINDLVINGGNFGRQWAFDFFTGASFVRNRVAGSFGGWKQVTDANGDGPYVRPTTQTAKVSLAFGMAGILNAILPGFENNTHMYVASPDGRSPMVAFTRASDNPVVGDMATQGGTEFVLANGPRYTYGRYTEHWKPSGSDGYGAHGHEINLLKFTSDAPQIDPYNPYVAGLFDGFRTSMGRTDVPGSTYSGSASHTVVANGAKFLKGMVFGHDALVMTSGQADAINLAKGHAIQQWGAPGVRGSRIRLETTGAATAMQQIFGDSIIAFQDNAGANLVTISTSLLTSALPIKFPAFLRSTKPSAAAMGNGATIHILDDPSARRLASSDGTNWRYQDGVVVT